MPLRRRYFFSKIENKQIYMYMGSLQDFYWKKGTYECLYVPCVHFHIKVSNMKHYLTNILKIDTSSGDMNEKVDHWLDSFEIFHKKYIIMPLESSNHFFLGESLYVTFWSPPGFINRENESVCYLNETIQLLYCNVLFRQLILNIYCYTIMIGLERKPIFCSSLPKDHDCEGVTESFLWYIFRK